MPNQKDESKDQCEDKKPSKTSKPGDRITLRSAGEVVITHRESAEKAPKDKRIHPRRPMPKVPEAPPEDKEGDPEQEHPRSSERPPEP